jgi:hypothetical protein
VAEQADARAIEAVSRMYFFMVSDAYREFRETEVRWECYAASQYHFDDGVKFILEAVEAQTPVDHPVWTLYGEKVAEIGARVAQAEERKLEMLAALKAVHQAFLRFCREKHLDPNGTAGLEQALPSRVLELLREDARPPSETVADEAYRLLVREWERNMPVGKTG